MTFTFFHHILFLKFRDCLLKRCMFPCMFDVLSTSNSNLSPLSKTLSMFSIMTVLTCLIKYTENESCDCNHYMQGRRNEDLSFSIHDYDEKTSFKSSFWVWNYLTHFTFDTTDPVCIRIIWKIFHLFAQNSRKFIIHGISKCSMTSSAICLDKFHMNIFQKCKRYPTWESELCNIMLDAIVDKFTWLNNHQ